MHICPWYYSYSWITYIYSLCVHILLNRDGSEYFDMYIGDILKAVFSAPHIHVYMSQ